MSWLDKVVAEWENDIESVTVELIEKGAPPYQAAERVVLTKETLLPKGLVEVLEKEIYKLWCKGVPVKEAIKIGIKIAKDY